MEYLIYITLGIAIVFWFLRSKSENKTNSSVNIINQNKILDYLNENNLTNNKKFISRDYSNSIVLDEKENKIYFITKKYEKENGEIEFNFNKYNTSKIIESEIVIDNQSVYKTVRSSQLIGAAVGGTIGGAVGMVIGGLSGDKFKQENIKSINLKIRVEDLDSPSHKINFLINYDPITKKEIKNGYSKDSSEVKAALNNIERWQGIMDVLIKQQNKVVNS